jgi:hypothetical protein
MSPTAKFNKRWIPEPYSGCWIWTGAAMGRPLYGCIRLHRRDGKQTRAHRLSWEIHRGSIPDGLCVCHKCDTPLCVNPDHLFLATNIENTADRVRKGRNANQHGTRHHNARLTEQDVFAIRCDSRTRKDIARHYKIHPVYVWKIKTKRRWGHL